MKEHHSPRDPLLESFLERNAAKFISPFEAFIRKQTTASILLLAATVVSICVASSPWHFWLDEVAQIELGVVLNHSEVMLSLREWVSSGLMTLFFLLIGLEVKREMLAGSLQDIRQVVSILFAALGGMVLPAIIYWGINLNSAGAHGWAIPMATDTAFAIAALALIVRRSAPTLASFLAALAIFDDLGAIAVVALFYSHELNYFYLLLALIPLGLLLTLNVLGVRRGSAYVLFGVLLWWFIFQSGVHATLAGVLIALAVPARTQLAQNTFVEKLRTSLAVFEEKLDFSQLILKSSEQHSLGMNLERTVKSAMTPLQRWHSFLLGPVGIFVLPLFALFSAGVQVSSESITTAITSPVTLGIIAGLVIGKPLGITLFTVVGRKFGRGNDNPYTISLSDTVMVGMLSGIGFTMSLFISTLSFPDNPELIQPAKIGIVVASILSAVAAGVWAVIVRR